MQIGRSEELGTGIKKVYKCAKAYAGSANISFMEQDVFVTKVPLENVFFETSRDCGGINDPVNEPANEPANEPVNDRQKEIISLIHQNHSISINELSKICKVGRETIKRDLNKLKQMNLIQRIGSDKGGYWQIVQDN
jgi:ATP-dependent DNA helicase RecG